ncbi:MAG TPA: alpha/beta hydrolase [Longimicrobium sp.]|nr:alpha/beta hydrolase [Longimicrobium sp.]
MKTNRIELGRGAFSYLEDGPSDGPLALLFHGFPDIPRTFQAQLAALAEAGYHAVAPWMRGYAPSTLQPPFDGEQLSGDMVALAEALGGGKPVELIGHDWGAVYAYQAVARAPQLFRHLVTMAVPHPTTSGENMGRSPAQLRRSWYVFFLQLGGFADSRVAKDDFALIERLWRDWSPGYRAPPEHLAELKRCLKESMPAPTRYYRTALRPGELSRSRRLFSGSPVSVPTLHLHGAQDGCIGPEMGKGQERHFNGRFSSEIVPGAGHFLHLERPDEVNARILAWLKQ